MFRLILLFCLIFGQNQISHAQIPGYLGKRTIIQFDLQSFPSLRGPTANNRGWTTHFGPNGGGFAFNWRAGISGSYVVSRQGQVTFGFDYLKTGMILDLTNVYEPIPNFGYEYYYHELFYNLTVKTINLGYRKFDPIKGSIAPFGNYRGLFIDYSMIDGEIIDKNTVSSSGFTSHPPLEINPKMDLISFGVEFGQNFIISDQIVFNMAVRVKSPLNILLAYQEKKYSEDVADNQGLYKTTAARRLAYHSLFMVNLGIGYLF